MLGGRRGVLPGSRAADHYLGNAGTRILCAPKPTGGAA